MAYPGNRLPPFATDALGHDCPATADHIAEQMLGWLDLEAACGDLTPGLAELRDRLREERDA